MAKIFTILAIAVIVLMALATALRSWGNLYL